MAGNITLTELQLMIRDSLYMALPEMYWVVAEISELKENNAGHCYMELIEKHPDEKNVRSKAKAIIWSNRYRFLKSFFENSTGESLKEGLKILIRTKVEYHELYGLSLVISDIDPAFTVGDMAIKRQLIIKKLEQEGVLSMNSELDFPLLPQRIAVISSRNAAGYTDFINHLSANSFKYAFYTALIDSPMQGTDTEQGITNALNKIAEKIHLFDLVVIIRGGGSQSDLSWFDNYNIAYLITQFPLPVLTGIGHDKDLSVTDMVAYKALKTPTAVAGFLIDCMCIAENQILEMSTVLNEYSVKLIENYRKLLDSQKLRIVPMAQVMVAENRELVSSKMAELISVGKGFTLRAGKIPLNHSNRIKSEVKSFLNTMSLTLIKSEGSLRMLSKNSVANKIEKIKSIEKTLNMLDPVNVLKRGYTITSKDGIILKTSDNVTDGDIINTQFSDGRIRSKVSGKESSRE